MYVPLLSRVTFNAQLLHSTTLSGYKLVLLQEDKQEQREEKKKEINLMSSYCSKVIIIIKSLQLKSTGSNIATSITDEECYLINCRLL